SALPTIPSGETVWIDDVLPSGSSIGNCYFLWMTGQAASGTKSLAPYYAGAGNYSSTISGLSLPVAIGEKAVAYMLINECVAPREVKITWYTTTRGSKAAYWGQALLGGDRKRVV